MNRLGIGTRSKTLAAAQRWLGVKYDYSHGDLTWRDLRNAPEVLDCSTFTIRVAMESLGYSNDFLAPNAGWLLDNLRVVETPQPGDLVGYGRAAVPEHDAIGHDVVWHVMVYLGAGMTIGACDLAGQVVVRPLDYEMHLGTRQWKLIVAPPFRALALRSHPGALA